jgi:hypothetical protein
VVKSEGEMKGGALKDVCSCQMLERCAQCTSRSRSHHEQLEGSVAERKDIEPGHLAHLSALLVSDRPRENARWRPYCNPAKKKEEEDTV